MVNNSAEFLYEITRSQRNKMEVSGYFERADGSVEYVSDENIAVGTLKISKKSVSKNYFNIGEAYIDMLDVTLTTDSTHTWSNLIDSILILNFTIYTDLNEPLVCPLGKWDVLSDGVTRKLSSVKIVGDSFLNRLDKKLEAQTFGTPFTLFSYACEQCNIPFRMLESDFSSLPNGGYVYYVSDLSKVSTYRDMLMWVSQALVGYVTIDTDGYLVFKDYTNGYSFTPNKDTLQSSEIGDYTYELTGLQTSIDGVYYNSGLIGSGNYIELDSNPILLGGTPILKQIIVNNIFSALSSLSFKSFNVVFNGNPSVECGDMFVINDRWLSCPVQQIDWVYRGKSTIRGYIPSTVSDVGSQGIKTASTSSGGTGSKFVVSRYRNSTELSIGSAYTQVASIFFATPEVATPMMLFTMRSTLSEQCDITFRLTYDNVVQDLDPKYTLIAGYFTFDFTNTLAEAVAGSDHTLIVEVSCSTGSIVVDVNDCVLSIFGYGVVGQGGNFSGYLNISEPFNGINGLICSGTPISGFSESVSVNLL